MKRTIILIFIGLCLMACENTKEISSINPVNWKKRMVNETFKTDSTFIEGRSYLSVYSQIYSDTEPRTYNLTATISMRNTNYEDTIYLKKAEYFDTKGSSIRTYFKNTIYIAPMETVEIIIDESDKDGGTGANFIFDWIIKEKTNEPLFEGIMISTYNRGLSFATNSKRIK